MSIVTHQTKCLFQTNQQHNLQHIKETDPNLSASPASSKFLLSAATNTTYPVIYHTLYSIIMVGTFSFSFFSSFPFPFPFSFFQAPLKPVNCQSHPLQVIPPLYWFFEKPPVKVGFFSEPPKH